jgi:hypothetical protein
MVYLDGEDKEPLKTNSAKIQIYLIEKDWNWGSGIVNLGLAFLKINPSPETVIADVDVRLLVENNGDDYTNFVNYDVIFEVSNHKVGFITDSIGKMNKKERITKTYHKTILLKEVPNLVWNAIIEWNTGWEIKYDNLNYEKFN